MAEKSFRAFSAVGNIAIVNFSEDVKKKDKLKFANKILKENKHIKSVLEKSGNFKGRLRKMETKHLTGEKTKEVVYRENNCVFRFNVDSSYFSPRLSNERKEILSKIKKRDRVLVMFAGVGPFTVTIAKNTFAEKVYHNEINREANKYAKLNVELNNVKDKVEFVQGDVKKVVEKLKLKKEKFDVILMPRPKLKDSYLKQAFMLSKKGTRIFYYDFCGIDETDLIVDKIKEEAKKFRKKIRILNVKKAGEIAPYKIRLRVDFEVD